MGLRVVLPAQRQHLQPLVDDVGSVPAHADPVNMVQVCRLSADAALLCNQTVVDVIRHIVYIVQQRNPARNIPVQDKVDEIPLKRAYQAHGRVGQGKQLVPRLLQIIC